VFQAKDFAKISSSQYGSGAGEDDIVVNRNNYIIREKYASVNLDFQMN